MVFLRDIFGKHGNIANKGFFELKIAVFLVFIIFLFAIPAQGRYSGGNGEPNTPYRIGTAEDLNDIANHPNDFIAHFVMVNDINLADYTGTQFNIIGDYSTRFAGVFDGNSNTIYNFSYNDPAQGYVGLFGYLDEPAQIKNLGLEDVNVVGYYGLGGLCGINRGTISNCYATGSVNGNYSLGGLCGVNYYGTISDCYATGDVTGGDDSRYLGGLCGRNTFGTISNCYATGDVSGGEYSGSLGGLCGFNDGTISNCYATGSVSGGDSSDYLGGLCGENYFGTISNCYATGSVTGGDDSGILGGLCGYNSGTISDCYATGNVTGDVVSDYLGGLCGENNEGTISDCNATGNVTGDDYLGGLCGSSEYGTISNCYATGSVNGKGHLGGLCGLNSGNISNCYATGNVNGEDNYRDIGGLIGYNTYGTISNSYSKGDVKGVTFVGGFVGMAYYRSTINYCYSTGKSQQVQGDSTQRVGAFAGDIEAASFTSCFWDSDVNPDMNGIGNGTDPNVIAATTTEMQTESTFTDEGWDFVGETINGPNDLWDICEATNYPRLVWSIPQADLLCPDGVDFIDYSYFANCWDVNDPNCDFDESGYIDANDLILFGDDWLRKY